MEPGFPEKTNGNKLYVELHAKAGGMAAAQFLRNLVKSVPYAIHKVLTDNGATGGGIPFTNRTCDRYAAMPIFDRVCADNGIEHRLTKVKHPWTNGKARADEPDDQGRHRQALPL